MLAGLTWWWIILHMQNLDSLETCWSAYQGVTHPESPQDTLEQGVAEAECWKGYICDLNAGGFVLETATCWESNGCIFPADEMLVYHPHSFPANSICRVRLDTENRMAKRGLDQHPSPSSSDCRHWETDVHPARRQTGMHFWWWSNTGNRYGPCGWRFWRIQTEKGASKHQKGPHEAFWTV